MLAKAGSCSRGGDPYSSPARKNRLYRRSRPARRNNAEALKPVHLDGNFIRADTSMEARGPQAKAPREQPEVPAAQRRMVWGPPDCGPGGLCREAVGLF